MCLFASCGQQAEENLQLGESVSLNSYDFVMDELVFLNNIEHIQPPEGKTFLAMRFHYTNTTEETQKYTTMPMVQLLDEDGKEEYKIDYEASNIYAIMNGIDFNIMKDSLEAGEVREDAEVYVVDIADVGKDLVVQIVKTNYYYDLKNVQMPADGAQPDDGTDNGEQ